MHDDEKPVPITQVLLYDQKGNRCVSGPVPRHGGIWPYAGGRVRDFGPTGIHVGNIAFFLERGTVKAWRREVAVSPELVTDGGALETVAVGLAMHDEAEEGTIYVWAMRVLPACEGDDMIRLWLCGSAVPKSRAVNERQG